MSRLYQASFDFTSPEKEIPKTVVVKIPTDNAFNMKIGISLNLFSKEVLSKIVFIPPLSSNKTWVEGSLLLHDCSKNE